MPADHHHASHDRGQMQMMSMIIENIATNIDELDWKSNHNDHEIRALRRDYEELRTRQGKTQEALEVFMASFVWEAENPPPMDF